MSGERWIVVRNWDRFQHPDALRGEGIPPWFKVYTKLVHNPDFERLTDPQRGHLLTIWVHYAASDGQLTVTSWAKACHARGRTRTLEVLRDAGFIDLVASRPLAARLQHASLEERREEENPPTPLTKGGEDLRSDNGRRQKLTKRELARYTGCKHTRGTHGFGHKHTALGQDPPPKDWPHPPPTQTEVEAALAAAAEFIAGVTE